MSPCEKGEKLKKWEKRREKEKNKFVRTKMHLKEEEEFSTLQLTKTRTFRQQAGNPITIVTFGICKKCRYHKRNARPWLLMALLLYPCVSANFYHSYLSIFSTSVIDSHQMSANSAVSPLPPLKERIIGFLFVDWAMSIASGRKFIHFSSLIFLISHFS